MTFLKQSLSEVNAKPKEMQIVSDTQLKTAQRPPLTKVTSYKISPELMPPPPPPACQRPIPFL